MAYLGFNKLKAKVAKGGASNPGAVAAAIGRKKYGKKKFQAAAAKGKKLKGAKPAKKGKSLNDLDSDEQNARMKRRK